MKLKRTIALMFAVCMVSSVFAATFVVGDAGAYFKRCPVKKC